MIDALCLLALLGGLAGATLFLNTLITMTLSSRRRRKRSNLIRVGPVGTWDKIQDMVFAGTDLINLVGMSMFELVFPLYNESIHA